MRVNQIAQVRGFADQQLRLPDKPEDPSNRRISIIVEYLRGQASAPAPATPVAKPAEAHAH